MDLLDLILAMLKPQVSQGWGGDEFSPAHLLSSISNLIVMTHTNSGDAPQEGTDKELSEARRRSLKAAMSAADTILHLLLQTQVAKEQPYLFQGNSLQALGARTTAVSIHHSYYSSSVRVEFPQLLLADLRDEEVFQLVSSVETNPFPWGCDLEVSSSVASISFSFINGSRIQVKDLPAEKRISISVDSHPSPPGANDDQVTLHTIVPPQSQVAANIHCESLINSEQGAILSLVPQIESHKVKKPVKLQVLLAYDRIPDAHDYDLTTTIDARWDGYIGNRLHTNYTLFIPAR